VPSYRHRVPAGMGLVVAPGRRHQPATCGIMKVIGLTPLSWRWIIVMAITRGPRGIVTVVPHRYEPRPAAESERKL
jgi:hypothetical protein